MDLCSQNNEGDGISADSFRVQGLPKPSARVWYRDDNGRYRRLTRTVLAEKEWIVSSVESAQQVRSF